MKKINLLLIAIVLGFFTVNAQETKEQESTEQESVEALSKQAANPVADLISIPFQNNLNMNQGPFDRNTSILNIQPVIPLLGGKVITRTVMPIVSIPDYFSESGKFTSGLADIVFTAFYKPESKGLTYGFGPVLEIPTGGSMRGSEKWSAGPSALVLVSPGDWTIGALINNVWSFAGDSDRADVNRMLLNAFVTRQLGNGWYVNSAPIITIDWEADSGDQLTLPLGAGGGKVVMLGGKLPLNLQTGLYYNVVRPEDSPTSLGGPEMQWRVQAQFLIPKSLFSGSK